MNVEPVAKIGFPSSGRESRALSHISTAAAADSATARVPRIARPHWVDRESGQHPRQAGERFDGASTRGRLGDQTAFRAKALAHDAHSCRTRFGGSTQVPQGADPRDTAEEFL